MKNPLSMIVAAALLLAACEGDPPKPAAPPATPTPAAPAGAPGATGAPAAPGAPGAPPTTPVAGEEELEAPEVAYAYSPVGKRDPFRSIFEDLVEKDKGDKETELQKFEIDQLKLVAVVTGRATPFAMVEDPGGKGHTITRGTLIGRNWGRVSGIVNDCVQVKEEYRDYTGRKVANQISMCLPKTKEELKLD